jgi:hypothetical protein
MWLVVVVVMMMMTTMNMMIVIITVSKPEWKPTQPNLFTRDNHLYVFNKHITDVRHLKKCYVGIMPR